MDEQDVFAPVPEAAAEERLRQAIEENLGSGKWAAGMRLPTERELSQSFSIARTRVRRVLDRFERDGRISRAVGRGTFVTGVAEVSVANLPERDIVSISPDELMEVRLLIEPQLADLLVRRASPADLDAIRALVEKGRRSTTMAQFEELDHRFHMALSVAVKNQFLTGVLSRIMAVRQSPVWARVRRRGLTEDRQKHYQRQHEAILAALEARDAAELRAAIAEHLSDVSANLVV